MRPKSQFNRFTCSFCNWHFLQQKMGFGQRKRVKKYWFVFWNPESLSCFSVKLKILVSFKNADSHIEVSPTFSSYIFGDILTFKNFNQVSKQVAWYWTCPADCNFHFCSTPPDALSLFKNSASVILPWQDSRKKTRQSSCSFGHFLQIKASRLLNTQANASVGFFNLLFSLLAMGSTS